MVEYHLCEDGYAATPGQVSRGWRFRRFGLGGRWWEVFVVRRRGHHVVVGVVVVSRWRRTVLGGVSGEELLNGAQTGFLDVHVA